MTQMDTQLRLETRIRTRAAEALIHDARVAALVSVNGDPYAVYPETAPVVSTLLGLAFQLPNLVRQHPELDLTQILTDLANAVRAA